MPRCRFSAAKTRGSAWSKVRWSAAALMYHLPETAATWESPSSVLAPADPALRADLGDRIERTWPWAGAFVLAWQRRTDLPALT